MRDVFVTALVWAIVAALQPAASAATSDESDLLKALKSTDETVRLGAIDTLGQLGEKIEGAIPALIEQLADDSAVVRAHAADALGHIGPPAKPAAEALAKLVFDKDPQVRREAVRAYRDIRPGPEVSLPLFGKLFAEADPAIRIHVMDALAEEGKAAVPGMIVGLGNEKTAYWACLVLAEIGPDAEAAVPALVKLLQTEKRPDVKREAIMALAAIGPAAAPAVPALAKALDDDEQINCPPAIFALGAIGPKAKATEEDLKKLASDKDSPPLVQTLCHWAVARMNPDNEDLARKVIPQLIQALTSENPRIRASAAWALISLDPDPEFTRPLIIKAMEDASPEVLNNILDALASLGEKAVPRLIAVLKEEELRPKAAAIIARIGPPAKAAVPALIGALSDPNPTTRSELLFALAAIGPDAQAAVQAATNALEDPDMNVRYSACYALGKIGRAAMPAKPALQKNLGSNDEFLSMASAWALSCIHPECPETSLKSVPILIKALEEPDLLTRVHAAESLGRLGPLANDAVPALKKALKNDDEQVRQAAADALKAVSK